MFGIFNRFRQGDTYVVYARSRTDHFIKQFTVRGVSAYDACRNFDRSKASDVWTRVSGATLEA